MPADFYETALRIVAADFVAAATRADQLPPATGVEIAFAGRSNVGKSSLLNSLLARKNLVRTSSKPGSTRTVSIFDARAADGLQLKLIDLPGYGYAKRSKAELAQWGQLMEYYLLSRPALVAVVLLVDVRRGLEDDDRDLLKLLAGPARVTRRKLGCVIAATKLDKVPTSGQAAAVSALKRSTGVPVYGYSAKTHAGRPELWRAIRRTAGLDAPLSADAQGTKPEDSAPSSSRTQSP
ncbi:MAG TPA: ribosome biogenesis GTP-binding protein YihA/YsxC [Polyangiaceae bacterium]|nr:ribosome biogenesis GTP-binding protein YihA/YsxC [Polyangiaceae bacterium]